MKVNVRERAESHYWIVSINYVLYPLLNIFDTFTTIQLQGGHLH